MSIPSHNIKRNIIIFAVSVCFFTARSFSQDVPATVYKAGSLKGKMIDCGFTGDANYHAIVHASDGNVYYVVCNHHPNINAHMFRYNPRTDEVSTVADLGKVLGEDPTKTVPQGKVHGDLYEHDGKLYFGTHVGYDRLGSEDHDPYPGGHFMSYDLVTGKFEDFGIGVAEEGMVSMNMGRKRQRLYALTWPKAIFVYYDLKTGTMKSFGESVVGHFFDSKTNKESGGSVPRSLGIDPRTGNVYWFNMDETINCYNYRTDTIETLEEPSLGLPVLKAKNSRVSWRAIRWNNYDSRFYGLTNPAEYLFAYDPQKSEIEVIDRIAPGPAKKSGEFSQPCLSFELSSDGRTVYYVSGYNDEDEKLISLVTYDIPLRHYTNHGPIVLQDGRNPTTCQGMEVGRDGNLYIVGVIPVEDIQSKKGKKLLKIRTVAEKKELSEVSEVNLVVMKDPL
ncbi:hypothetical protein ACFL1R_05920 [Candidatus Latescibacterota bacterium]